jgi:aromatic-L-amino-acid decarboxylase
MSFPLDVKSPAPGADRASLPLDADREAVLAHAAGSIAEAWRSFDRARPFQPPVDRVLRELLAAPLPAAGTPALQGLDEAAAILDESLAQARPRFFGYVGGSGLEVGVLADALAACHDVNLAGYAAAATDVERQALRWLGEFVGYPAAAGASTSGGTLSSLTALTAARERALPGSRRDGFAGRRAAIYTSDEAHHSVDRAAEVLGLGTRGVRGLPIDGHRRLRGEVVARAIEADRAQGIVPLAVVASAGTTLTGAVDPLDELADVCAVHGVWLHVDGAYGLPAASVPDAAPLFAGLERADSVSIDAHKWLYLPKACSVVLVRERGALEAAFAHDEEYMPADPDRPNPVDTTLEYSRPFRALKLWLAFRVHGADALRAAIARNLAQARLLADEVRRHPDLELMVDDPPLSIVPFRHRPHGVADLDAHNRRLARALQDDGRVYVAAATIDGRACLRPCLVNFRTDDDDVRALVTITRELGTAL